MTFACISWRSLAAVALATVFSAAQQTPTVATTDPQAVALLQAAITAMGGQSAAQSINSAVASGSNSTAFHGFVWKDTFSGGQHEFRRELTDGTNTRLLASGHGNPATGFNGKARKLYPHVAYAMWPLHLPIVILNNILQNPNYRATLGPQIIIGNSMCNQVLVKDQSNPVTTSLSVQRWYLDASTGLPVRVQYRIADAISVEDYETGYIDYSDFRSVSGVLVPFQLAASKDGKSTGVVAIASMQLNVTISASDFDISGVQQ
jgi:hypothetical protein